MKKKTTCISLFLAVVVIIGCSSCGAPRDAAAAAPEAVAIVIGNHACSRELNLNSPTIKETITNVVDTGGFLSIISVDGSPDVVAAGSFAVEERFRNADPSLLAREAQAKAVNLLMELSEVRADTPEVDSFEGIRLARRTLSDAPEGANLTILVIDTGLNTTGQLPFVNNLLSADPSVIADMLEERKALPDLTGIHVLWQQLGDVAAPQEELTPKQFNRLKEIWSEILTRSGATYKFLDSVPNDGTLSAGLPEVSVVDLPDEIPIYYEETIESGPAPFADPVILDESRVRFVPDSAEYLERAAAEAVIVPIAEYMLAHGDVTLLLAGTTAGDAQSDKTIGLSQSRANAVRATMISHGVPENRIIALGLGSEDPWHIYGLGTGGQAAPNRKVVILDADSDTARDLLGRYYG